MGDYTTIIVEDEYIKEMSEYFASASENLQEMLDTYNKILIEVLEDAIVNGECAATLSLFELVASSLGDEIKKIGTNAHQLAVEYLSDIDEADSYLY